MNEAVGSRPGRRFRAEYRAHMVGSTDRHIEEAAASARTQIGHCGLYKMTDAVQLVKVEIRPSQLPARTVEIRVHISVFVLGGLDHRDHIVEPPSKINVACAPIRPGSSLEHFVDIGVVVVPPLEDLLRAVGSGPSGATEILNAAGAFAVV